MHYFSIILKHVLIHLFLIVLKKAFLRISGIKEIGNNPFQANSSGTKKKSIFLRHFQSWGQERSPVSFPKRAALPREGWGDIALWERLCHCSALAPSPCAPCTQLPARGGQKCAPASHGHSLRHALPRLILSLPGGCCCHTGILWVFFLVLFVS